MNQNVWYECVLAIIHPFLKLEWFGAHCLNFSLVHAQTICLTLQIPASSLGKQNVDPIIVIKIKVIVIRWVLRSGFKNYTY